MKKRNIWIAVVALLLVASIAAAVMLPARTAKPVFVYPVSMISYTEQSADVAESFGVVTTDKVQTIYITDTQTVKEVFVKAGDTVRKGDVLYTYDTTLTDLSLERKDLAIQQLQLNLKNAKEDLKKLKAMKPMVVNTPSVAEIGKSPSNPALLGTVYDGKGTIRNPYLFWMMDSGELEEEFIWEHLLADKKAGTKVYVIFQTTVENKPKTEFKDEFGVIFTVCEKIVETEPPETTEPSEPQETTVPTEPAETTVPSGAPNDDGQPVSETDPMTIEDTQPKKEQYYTIRFFNPKDKEIGTTVDWNSGYTQSELTTMREEKTAEIQELEFAIKVGKSELEIMKKEASDGKVYAAFDGVVAQVMDPEDAQLLEMPMLKITGGGGYYVVGQVSELELSRLSVGQRIDVHDWDSGERYEGVVSAIGNYPSENQDAESGAVNVTYYPYTVFVEDTADLQEGAYVSLSQAGNTGEGVLYLENAFIRNEGKDSFVYVRNEAGLLEKRMIRTGVSTDGYATPVYSGLTEGDFVAFPYDKNIQEGAQTQESGIDELYGN